MDKYGQAIDFNGYDIAGCNNCGWRGVATLVDGERLLICPCCGLFDEYKSIEAKFEAERYGKVGRNDPCPCGSGRKYKRCCQS